MPSFLLPLLPNQKLSRQHLCSIGVVYLANVLVVNDCPNILMNNKTN